MLVFFLHGVATSNAQYGKSLSDLVRDEFGKRNQALPNFCFSFWGSMLKETDKIWNGIREELQRQALENPEFDSQDSFRYQDFREGYFSHFVGDAFTYLNLERGKKIRENILEQLRDFLSQYPRETDLHFVAHSLGTAILWDILFSERFEPNDPALKIREMLNGLEPVTLNRKVLLKSITTMGTPIAFLNIALGINQEAVRKSLDFHNLNELRWLNIINPSDILAYPLQPLMNGLQLEQILIEDKYVEDEPNATEKALREISNQLLEKVAGNFVGIANPQIKKALSYVPILGGAVDSHQWYWKSAQVACLIADNFLGAKSCLVEVISRIEKVPGMTKLFVPFKPKNEDLLLIARVMDESLTEIEFRDRSGKLRLTKNILNIHHIYLFNGKEICEFAGYVNFFNVEILNKEIRAIKRDHY